MDYAVVVSAIVLGLSVLASIAKFLDWFMHSDPRTMVRTSRWMLLLVMLVGLVVLGMAIAREQWSLAMLSAAGTFILGTFLKWRTLFVPLGAILARFGPGFRPRSRPGSKHGPRPFDMEVWQEADDAEKVRHAAALLEAYVRKSAVPALEDARRRSDGLMSRHEALEVLGLPSDADEATIRAAHQRLRRLVDPDSGGSAWLAVKIEQAGDALLADAAERRNVA
jgi:hypothetical protein